MDKLKPSQLLRLGATQVHHVTNDYFVKCDDDDITIIGACALGMMSIAKHGQTKYCPELSIALSEVKEELKKYNINPQVVVTLNDDVGCSPEEIAQWLEHHGA